MNTINERILYQSDACVVVNKLPGEAVEGGASVGSASVGSASVGSAPVGGASVDGASVDAKGAKAGAKAVSEDLPRLLAAHLNGAGGAKAALSAVHRLDVPVSGCCLFTRTTAAFSFLTAAFADQKTEKHYWAIVEKPESARKDALSPIQRELVHYILTDTKRNKSIAYEEDGPGRKKAILRYRTVGEGERYFFLEITLITGRHHQIRAQLARIGLHIKGDLKYGARRSEVAGGIRLHAYSLAFPDTSGNGEIIRVSALPPLADRLWQAFPQETE